MPGRQCLPRGTYCVILHSFSGSDGFDGAGGLIEASDGHLYGTTSLGGANDLGAAFRIDRDGSNFAHPGGLPAPDRGGRSSAVTCDFTCEIV